MGLQTKGGDRPRRQIWQQIQHHLMIHRLFLVGGAITLLVVGGVARQSFGIGQSRDSWAGAGPGTIPEIALEIATENQKVSVEFASPAQQAALLQDLATVQVVYLGETHDQPADQAAQLDLIQQLSHRMPQLAIGMEMFQRPYQTALNQYLAGEISETELRDRTEFDRRWGYEWEHYAPILRFAQAQQIPVVALNAPTEATRHIAQFGLTDLEADWSQWIPDPTDLELGPPAYQDHLQAIYEQIHQGTSYSMSAENFFLAQIIWDETMALAIADYLQAHPDTQMLVLTGQGHITYGHGIPRRVARRLTNREDFQQRSLLLNPSADQVAAGEGVIADYFWFSKPEG
jgi:uncharacterized iron-regulated protein